MIRTGTRPGRVVAGITMCLAATVFFASMDSTSKVVMLAGVPTLLAVWARYLVQAVLTTAFVLPMGGPGILRTRAPLMHLVRGLLLATTTVILFVAMHYMPVGEFTAIVLVAPLVITLMAGLFFKEHVSPLRWSLVAGGFTGTLVILRPGGEAFTLAMLLPLVHIAANTAFQLITSRMARTENPLTMHLYTSWVGALVVMPLLPRVWGAAVSPAMWGLIALMGVLAAVGHLLLILAYQRAPAAALMPTMYAQIAFAMAAGWILFDHVPDGWSLLGMALIALCGVGGAALTVFEQRRA